MSQVTKSYTSYKKVFSLLSISRFTIKEKIVAKKQITKKESSYGWYLLFRLLSLFNIFISICIFSLVQNLLFNVLFLYTVSVGV